MSPPFPSLEPIPARAPVRIHRDAIENACDVLSAHYERVIQEGPPERREHAYQAHRLNHEVRVNLTSPRASYVPGRSVQELSRLCVLARDTAVAFEPEVASSWEFLAIAMASAIGPTWPSGLG